MYAVIKTGGKQYRVEEKEIINVELLKHVSEGDEVTFDEVLLVAKDDEIKVGQPLVEGASVTATSLGTAKGPKVIIFKHSGRTTMRRKTGHRQKYTQLRIDSITA
jgi:large subunit ribosomal protein L21